jgi:hypothetical protein
MISITFSAPAGEITNSFTWPVMVTWKASQGSPTRNTMSPRDSRISEQPWASRSSSTDAHLLEQRLHRQVARQVEAAALADRHFHERTPSGLR